jgi:hypothetical protein
MATGRREKDIKLLVAKFIKLVESLNPGERLSIKKVAAKRRPAAKGQPRKADGKAAGKAADSSARRQLVQNDVRAVRGACQRHPPAPV